jgi:hypothetical protein
MKRKEAMLSPVWKQRLKLCKYFVLASWLMLGIAIVTASVRTDMRGEQIIAVAFVVIAVPLFFKGLSWVIRGKLWGQSKVSE